MYIICILYILFFEKKKKYLPEFENEAQVVKSILLLPQFENVAQPWIAYFIMSSCIDVSKE